MNKRENLFKVIKHDNPAWVPCGVENEIFLVHPIIERPSVAGKDDWGVYWDYNEEGESGTYPTHNELPITDIEHWKEQIHIPRVEDYDWTNIKLGWDRKPIDLNTIDRTTHWVTGALDFGIFERMYLLLGMENALVYLMTEPEIMMELADALADYNVRVIEKFSSVVQLDMIRYGDDWGSQDQLLIPPNTWRQIIKPAVQKVYDAIHAKGLMVFQHSCGKIEDIFGDIVEMGVDIYDPAQPCNNLKKLKELYGNQVTFCGAIDSQHVLGYPGVTEEQVRAEVRKCIDTLAAGGGYIARPSHDIKYEDHVMQAMQSEIKNYGKYLYPKDFGE